MAHRRSLLPPAKRRAPRIAPWIAPWIVWPVVTLTALMVVAGSSYAAFTAKVSNNGSSLAAATYFRCSGAIAALSPYFWYRLDETSASTLNATDSSGNNRTGRYNSGGKTMEVARACGPLDTGTAVTFDGSSGYLSSPVISGGPPNTFTEQLWFKTTTTRGGNLIGWGSTQTGSSNEHDRHIYMTNSGQLVFGVYPNAVRTVTSPKSYNDGLWHQVVATLSGAGMRLYVDGALVGSDPSTTTAEAGSGGYWRIAYENLDGWINVPSSRYFAGTIDDAVVYLSALTPAQVQDQYDAASPRPGVLTVSRTSVAFGDVRVGSSATENVTLTNTGATDIRISSASGPGAPFSISPSLAGRTVAGGDSLTVAVTYTPVRASNADLGSFTFTPNDGSAASTVSLTGSTTGGIVNLALNKAATQSSNYGDFYAPRAVDGNTNGVVNNGSVSHTNSSGGTWSWWQVDLGATKQVDQITLWNRTDCCADRLSNYSVFASATPFDTGLTPTQQAAKSGVWSSRQTTQPNPSVSIDLPTGTQARYVMVQLNVQNVYLQLAEVLVNGPP